MAKKNKTPDRPIVESPGSRILTGALLVGSIFLIYWRATRFPFIQDDWSIVASFLRDGFGKSFVEALNAGSDPFFRPVGRIYLLILFQLFHLDPAGYHWAGLILHSVNALLVMLVFRSILRDPLAAWSTAFLYAAAVTIHRDPLFWIVGAYDLLGVLFFLLSSLLFLNGRRALSAVAYAFALLSKEGTIILPLVLAVVSFLQHQTSRERASIKFRQLIGELKFHLPVLILYVLLLVRDVSLLNGRTGENVYEIGIFGPHVIDNLVTYGRWCLEQFLFPLTDQPWIGWAAASACALLAVLFVVGLKKESRRQAVALCCWIVIAIAPVLPFTHHSYRYYLIYAMPAFYALCVLLLAGAAGGRQSLRIAILVMFVGVNIILAERYTAAHDQDSFEVTQLVGSNNLPLKATVIHQAEDFLRANAPTVGDSTVLVFNWLPTEAFGRSFGPRLWTGDPTLRVYEAPEVGIARGIVWVTDPPMVLGKMKQLPSSVKKIILDPQKIVCILTSHFGEPLRIGTLPTE